VFIFFPSFVSQTFRYIELPKYVTAKKKKNRPIVFTWFYAVTKRYGACINPPAIL